MHEASYTIEAFVRTLVYVPSLLLIGFVSFRHWYRRRAEPRLTRGALIASLVLLLAVLLRAAAYAHTAFGEDAFSWESLRLVTVESRWGSRWRWQLLAAAGAAISLGVALVRDELGWVMTTVSALGLCVSLPLTGHAMALGTAALFSQTGHVLGAGIWVGTLGVVKLFAAVHDDDSIFRRFAPLAGTGVVLLLVSGCLTAWYSLPSFDALWQSLYGRLLLIKAAAVALVLLCGFLNWRRFRTPNGPARDWVIHELLFAMLVLGVTGWLAESSPP